jgi:predicted ATPase with chaperone activity
LWEIWLMSVCRARSLSLFGIDALPVEVEVDVSSGLPGFSIVGLPDAAVQEARERVRVAISNSGYKFPTKKVIVNLAPANLRKEGPAFDLPIALGILAASGALPAGRLDVVGVVGELSALSLTASMVYLSNIRGVRGVLPWCTSQSISTLSLSSFACSFRACLGLVVSNAPPLLQ